MRCRDRTFIRRIERAQSPEAARAIALNFLDAALGDPGTSVAVQRQRTTAGLDRVRKHLCRWHQEVQEAQATVLLPPGPRRIGSRGRRFVAAVDRASQEVDVRFAVEQFLRRHLAYGDSVEQSRHILADAIAVPLQRLVRNQEVAERAVDACLRGAGWLPRALADADAARQGGLSDVYAAVTCMSLLCLAPPIFC